MVNLKRKKDDEMMVMVMEGEEGEEEEGRERELPLGSCCAMRSWTSASEGFCPTARNKSPRVEVAILPVPLRSYRLKASLSSERVKKKEEKKGFLG